MTKASRLKLYNWLSGLIPDLGRLMFIRAAFLRWCGVEVEKDCEIAPTVRFSGCVTLHKACVVGAGSVVTKDVDAWTVVGGNPAKFLKRRELMK